MALAIYSDQSGHDEIITQIPQDQGPQGNRKG
jgi:hypothetical protein